MEPCRVSEVANGSAKRCKTLNTIDGKASPCVCARLWVIRVCVSCVFYKQCAAEKKNAVTSESAESMWELSKAKDTVGSVAVFELPRIY